MTGSEDASGLSAGAGSVVSVIVSPDFAAHVQLLASATDEVAPITLLMASLIAWASFS